MINIAAISNDSEEQRQHPLQDTTLLAALLLFGLTCCFLFFQWYQSDRKKIRLPGDLLHAPEKFITYRQTSVFTLPLVGEPTCFAVKGNTFIIGTESPSALWFFNEEGTLLQKIDMPEAPLTIACGTNETIFTDKIVVAHPTRIAAYTYEGNEAISWKLPGEESNVRSLVLTPDFLFAADTKQRSVHRFNADGVVDLTFGNFIVYASPIVMTYSPQSGLLYVANPGKHRVEVFTQAGMSKPELSWGKPSTDFFGFAGCCNPIGLAVLDDGRILTVEKAISRVKIFRDRMVDCIVAGPSVLDSLPSIEKRRAPLKPDRYFAAAVLSGERIAVFDFEYAAVRVLVRHDILRHVNNLPFPL